MPSCRSRFSIRTSPRHPPRRRRVRASSSPTATGVWTGQSRLDCGLAGRRMGLLCAEGRMARLGRRRGPAPRLRRHDGNRRWGRERGRNFRGAAPALWSLRPATTRRPRLHRHAGWRSRRDDSASCARGARRGERLARIPLIHGCMSTPQLGINAAADATNRLSVGAAATLLSHAGGHQLKVNKATAADTASFLFSDELLRPRRDGHDRGRQFPFQGRPRRRPGPRRS